MSNIVSVYFKDDRSQRVSKRIITQWALRSLVMNNGKTRKKTPMIFHA